jgi:nitrite reductase/ring-hydroxylating ferredoxin subunit
MLISSANWNALKMNTVYKTFIFLSINNMLYQVCRSNEIKEQCMSVFTIHHTDVLVGRTNGILFACNNSCPHRGASLSKGEFNKNNIVCYMHGYEFNVVAGNLESMKSWKKDDAWMEQSEEWRKAGNLTLYKVIEMSGIVYVELN